MTSERERERERSQRGLVDVGMIIIKWALQK
jgi:hypothetical protein